MTRNDSGKNIVIYQQACSKETPKQPTPPSSSEPRNRVNLNLVSQPEPKKPEPESWDSCKYWSTTISIISLVLAFVFVNIAAYILKKKKNS